MNTLTISADKIANEVQVPTSKSYANRALILAAIDCREVKIYNLPQSQDVRDMIYALTSIGLMFEFNDSNVIVKNSFPECEKELDEIHVYTGQGGTTTRFLISLLALGKRVYILDCDEQLYTRPIYPLVNALENLGVKIESIQKDVFPLLIQGPVDKGAYTEVDCSLSSQFASSLLLISNKSGANIDLVNQFFSLPYLNMTLDQIKNFTLDYKIPADFSSASYVIVWSVLNQDCVIKNIHTIDELQADSALVGLLNRSGANIAICEEGLRIPKAQKLSAFSFDVRHCPDLVPTLAYLMLFIDGVSSLKNLKIIKNKEVDRLQWIFDVYTKLDARYEYNEEIDELIVWGGKQLSKVGTLIMPDDHRIIMMSSLILKQVGGGTIANYQGVKKSFPNFFEIFN